MKEESFIPHHMNITERDIEGNKGIGRYIILPGSDGRAREISRYFKNVEVKTHPRCHNFYLGEIEVNTKKVDVAVVASGMGAPSVDIIVNELYRLGTRRILRIGTSGSLQPEYIRTGAIVIATGAVRDEGTSTSYMPKEIPAMASFEFIEAALTATKELGTKNVFSGVVHTKDSLYAREFKEGPLREENTRYMQILKNSGILASEMECSLLFTLGNVFNTKLIQKRLKESKTALPKPADSFLTGAILAVVGDDSAFSDPEEITKAEHRAITLGIETIKQLAKKELGL